MHCADSHTTGIKKFATPSQKRLVIEINWQLTVAGELYAAVETMPYAFRISQNTLPYRQDKTTKADGRRQASMSVSSSPLT